MSVPAWRTVRDRENAEAAARIARRSVERKAGQIARKTIRSSISVSTVSSATCP